MKHDGSPRVHYFRKDTSVGPGIPHLWVTVDVEEGWRADFRLAVQGKRFVVAEVRLFPRSDDDHSAGKPWPEGETAGVHAKVPDDGITARLLRRVPTQAHERAPYGFLHAVDFLFDTEGKRLEVQPAPTKPRRGRKPIPDEELLDVASVYAKAFEEGEKPTRAVVSAFPKISQARARDLVYRARQRGFLTTATQGRASGALTPEARNLVAKLRRSKARQKK